jgi:acetyl esterase/lipase
MKVLAGVLLLSASTLAAPQATPQAAPQQISLWANGAPGFERLKDEPEQAQSYWVRHVNNPSVTVFLPPKDKATGAGMVIVPGGGHSELVYRPEGVEAAEYLNSIGVAAFVLKYRLAKEAGSPYSVEVHARADAFRAMRLVRSRAAEWGVDPNRLGLIGFSAGGELASMVAFGPPQTPPWAQDAIDRVDSRPSFLVMIYPGPAGIPDTLAPTVPPAFLVVADDDTCCSAPVMKILQEYRAAGVSVEAHIFAKGGHAFNMGNRSKLATLKGWPERMKDWLGDNGWLTARASATAAR